MTNRDVEFYKNRIVKQANFIAEIEDDLEVETLIQEITNKVTRTIQGYPNDTEIRVCPKCGLPLVYMSMAYVERYHFDTCI